MQRIPTNSFIQVPLENNLVLSNKKDKLIILSPEGKTIFQEYSRGKTSEEIAQVLENQMDMPHEEITRFVNSFLSSLAGQSQETFKNAGDEHPVSLPDYLPFVTREYEIYGKRCVVRYAGPETFNIFHPLIAHSESKNHSSKKVDLTFDLISQDDTYAFYRNSREVVREKSLVYVKNVALFELFTALYPEQSWLTVFHSAVVQKADRAIILSGYSGKGKSTLTAYLTSVGFDLVSDDLGILEAENAGITYTPFAMSLKKDAWDLLSGHIPGVAALKPNKIYEEMLKFYMPSSRNSRLDPPPPLTSAILLFISYEASVPGKVEPLSPAEALSRLVHIGAWISHEENHLKKLTEWVVSTPAYELVYPDFSYAYKAIQNIMEGRPLG